MYIFCKTWEVVKYVTDFSLYCYFKKYFGNKKRFAYAVVREIILAEHESKGIYN